MDKHKDSAAVIVAGILISSHKEVAKEIVGNRANRAVGDFAEKLDNVRAARAYLSDVYAALNDDGKKKLAYGIGQNLA